MKEFLEEYGGIVVAAITGLMLLGFIFALVSDRGAVYQLAEVFFAGIGLFGM